MQEIQSLGQEDPLEKEMATDSSILAWKIPQIEETGRLQSLGSQRVGHDWPTNTHTLPSSTTTWPWLISHTLHVMTFSPWWVSDGSSTISQEALLPSDTIGPGSPHPRPFKTSGLFWSLVVNKAYPPAGPSQWMSNVETRKSSGPYHPLICIPIGSYDHIRNSPGHRIKASVTEW